jgi:hypothetical protein
MERLMMLAVAAALMAACGEGGALTASRVERPAEALAGAVDPSAIGTSEEDRSPGLSPSPHRRDADRLGDPGQRSPMCRRECSTAGRRRGSA